MENIGKQEESITKWIEFQKRVNVTDFQQPLSWIFFLWYETPARDTQNNQMLSWTSAHDYNRAVSTVCFV